jgi:hypothetical protein
MRFGACWSSRFRVRGGPYSPQKTRGSVNFNEVWVRVPAAESLQAE